MLSAIREYLIKLGLDISEVEKGMPRAQQAIDGTSSSLKRLKELSTLAGTGIAAVGGAMATLAATASRGDTVNSVARAFEKLQEAAGRSADQGIKKLREATTDLLSDFELMKASNLASNMGISPELFEELAGSADALADATGKDLPEALELLTTGFGRANDRALIGIGINIDQQKAETELAKKYGKTREELSELGKKQAFQIAALQALRERTKEVSSESKSAGEAFTRIGVAIQNQRDSVASSVDKNKDLIIALDKTREIINNIELAPFIELINKAGGAFVFAAEQAANFARGLDVLLGSSNTAKIANLDSQIADLNESLKEVTGPRGALGALSDGISRAFNPKQEKRSEIAARLKEQIALLEEEREKLFLVAVNENKVAEAKGKTNKVTKEGTAALEGNGSALFDNSKATDELAKKNAELAKSFSDLEASTKNSILVKGLEDELAKAAESLDPAKFQTALGNLESQLFKSRVDELTRQYGDAISKAQIDALAGTETKAAVKTITTDFEESQKQAFQNSVDFFADILTPMFEDTAFNFEDMMMDALKRVAIGFGSQLLAQVAGALGINVSGLGGAQGFGSFLAQSLFGAAGGGDIFSSLLGGASGGSSGLLAGLLGGAGGSSMLGELGVMTGAAAGPMTAGQTAIMGFGPYALAAGAAYLALDQFGVLESNFGGTSDPETMDRRNWRTRMEETMGPGLNFRGIRGDISLYDSDYNLGNRTQFTGDATGLVNPLAQIFTGGDDKLASDVAGIFADAVDDVGSYNEALIQTQSLMDSLGIDAEEAKNQLTALFLDGKISLDEFSSGVASLNVLATENLVGTGSVGDAIAILTDKLATPRHQLKAIELAFKEMGELGIDTTSEVSAYLLDKFGPAIADVFGQLSTMGIDSWEDIANASADQIAQIFGVLMPFRDEVADTFAGTADAVAQSFSDMTSQVSNDLNKIAQNSRDISTRISANLRFKATVEDETNDNTTPAEYTR